MNDVADWYTTNEPENWEKLIKKSINDVRSKKNNKA